MTTARYPPGPRGHWLLGNLPEFRRDMLGFYARLARDYGDVVSYRLGPRRLVMLAHPDAIEEVLVGQNRDFEKPYIYQFLRPLLGNGLLLSEGDFWLRQRKLMQPAFLKQRVDAYGPAMVEEVQRLTAGWRAGETRDIHADMMQFALAVAARTLLDVDVMDEAPGVGAALECVMADFSARFESVLPLPRWLPLPAHRRFRTALANLDRVVTRIIQERRSSSRPHADVLSLLMAARDEDGGGMDDRQLRDEVMTLFLAGHETTANGLTWTLYLLAKHPEVGEKLRAEATAVLAGRAPGVADLPRLPYAEWTILEAMRLYPPVYAISRRAVRDCTVMGFDIPPETTLLLPQCVLHRDARFFPDPEPFRPERWADGLTKRLPRYAYFPFGGGPRVCIGNTFGMLEMTLALTVLASRFRFTLAADHPVTPWPSITLRPKHGVRAVIHSAGA